jgi:hypothetical protein
MICMCGGLDEYLYSIVKNFWDKFPIHGIVRTLDKLRNQSRKIAQ